MPLGKRTLAPSRRAYKRRKLAARRRRPRVWRVPRFRTTGLPKVFRVKRFSDQLWTYGECKGAAAPSNPATTYSAFATTGNTELNSWIVGCRLEDIPNDSEFTSLFRYFKLTGVKIDFFLRGNVAPLDGSAFASGATGTGLPVLFTSWAPDMDAASMPGTLQAARQRANIRKHYFSRGNRKASVYIRPLIHNSVTDAAGSTFTTRGGHPWLSCANDKTALHSGLWFNIDNSHSAASIGLDIECTYYFAFKGMQ